MTIIRLRDGRLAEAEFQGRPRRFGRNVGHFGIDCVRGLGIPTASGSDLDVESEKDGSGVSFSSLE